MKINPAIFAIGLLLAGRQGGICQSFVNLNFESTTLATNGLPGTASTAIGLPGWSASIGGISQSTILYNNATLGNSSIAILGKGNSINPVIAGSFSTSLIAGATGDSAISQTGLVPTNAHSILFDAYAQGNGLPNLSVKLNGRESTYFLSQSRLITSFMVGTYLLSRDRQLI